MPHVLEPNDVIAYGHGKGYECEGIVHHAEGYTVFISAARVVKLPSGETRPNNGEWFVYDVPTSITNHRDYLRPHPEADRVWAEYVAWQLR